jgi:hypothetical protein
VETTLRKEEGEIKQNEGRGDLTKMYYKQFCTCHTVSSVQQ